VTTPRTIEPWIVLPPAELLVDVCTSPAPDIPLAALRDVLEPRFDASGTIVDWVLVTSSIREHASARDYWIWRQTWRRTWQVGPVSNAASLRQFVDELDSDLVPALADVLRTVIGDHEAGVEVPWATANELVAELDLLRLAISADERTGWGIVDDMAVPGTPVGLARTWAEPTVRRVMAATLTSSVQVRPGRGLVLTVGDADDDDRATIVDDIREVDLRDDPVRLLTAAGDRVELPAAVVRPLAWLVPHSLRWHLRPIPLALVWAPWFAGWPAAVEAAASTRAPISITSTAPIVV
jgi:hypothetical protein